MMPCMGGVSSSYNRDGYFPIVAETAASFFPRCPNVQEVGRAFPPAQELDSGIIYAPLGSCGGRSYSETVTGEFGLFNASCCKCVSHFRYKAFPC